MKNGARSTSAGGSAEMAPDQTHTRTLDDTACHTGQTRNKMLPDKAIRRPPVARDVYSWGAVCHEMPCEGAAALAVRVRATTRAGVPNETKVNVQFVSARDVALHVPAYDCLRSTLDAAVPAVANPSRRVPEKPSVGGGARPAASARIAATDPRATAGPGGLRMRPTRAGAPAAASDALRCHATTADTDAASALVPLRALPQPGPLPPRSGFEYAVEVATEAPCASPLARSPSPFGPPPAEHRAEIVAHARAQNPRTRLAGAAAPTGAAAAVTAAARHAQK